MEVSTVSSMVNNSYDLVLTDWPLSGGKSAVLSAITIALGGKANSTGRGSGLKSFIREGQP